MAQISIIKTSDVKGTRRLDAEYYQPIFLKYIIKLNSLPTIILKNHAFVTDGIHTSIQYDMKSKIYCISAQSVKDGFFILDREAHISSEQHKRNPRTSLKVDDVIVSSVGTIGNCAVVSEDILPANADRHVGIIRIKDKINPYFLCAFLNSKYGRFQTTREATGNVQLNLFIDKIKELIIPLLNNQDEIGSLVKNANGLLNTSKGMYLEAEKILLRELGLTAYYLNHQLTYIANCSKIQINNRIDAEFYQPKYQKIIDSASEKATMEKLDDLVKISKGIEVGSEEYREEGIPFVRVSNLSNYEINDNNQKYISNELFDKLKNKFKPKKGEILLSKDATPGIAFLIDDEKDRIISGGILRLRVDSDIDKNYLTMVLNSLFVQSQIERDAGGSIIVHWRPELIKETLIPVLPKPKQEEISKLVEESHKSRIHAKQLLEKAKKIVEYEIEKYQKRK